MNNRQWIQQMKETELAAFLRQIEQTLDGPWEQAFTDHFCPACDLRHLEICDHCPNGDAAMWWLRQIREERTA